MWAFGDLSAFPTDVGVTKNLGFYLWTGEGLGSLSIKPINYFSMITLFSVTLGSMLAQKVMFLSLFLISFLTFHFFARKFSLNPVPSLLGALFYSFNPVTISEFTGGSMTLIVYAIFPLILFYLFKFVQSPKLDLTVLAIFGILGFFIFNLHAAFWFIIFIIPLLLLDILLVKKGIKNISRVVILATILCLILIPNILGYTGVYGTSSNEKTTFESTAAYCYKDSAMYNILRLAGNTGSSQAREFLNYNTLNGYTVLGYILPIIAFLPFMTRNQKFAKNKNLFIKSAAIALLISSGLILLVKAMPSIVDLNPILGSLRNPVKLLYPLSFSLCFLFTIGVEKLLSKSTKKWYKQKRNIIISVALIAIILLYNYPALDGTLGLAKVRGENYYIEDKYYTLPVILTGIDADYEDSRILFLPWEYPSLLKIRSEIPNYFGVSLGAGISSDIKWLKDAFEITLTSSDRSDVLGLFGVKYVVIDKDFKSYYEGQSWYESLDKETYALYESQDSYWITGNASFFKQIFNSDSKFELIYDNQDFSIFKNNNALTKVYTRSDETALNFSYAPISDNLLKNPSFENNSEYWQLSSRDNSQITQDDQGNSVLMLYGKENTFTTSYQVVPVTEYTFYRLKFAVKGFNITDMHSKILWYDITENLTEGKAFSANYIKLSQMNLTEGQWYTIEEVFKAPKSAVRARIYFLANRIVNSTGTIMYIDNVSFQEVQKVISNKDEIFTGINNCTYSKISPTKYIINLHASSPLIIALSDAYNPSWTCYVNGEAISSTPLYGIINSFQVNQTAVSEITIEYSPQKWFDISFLVSISTLIACSAYLSYAVIKSRILFPKTRTKTQVAVEKTSAQELSQK